MTSVTASLSPADERAAARALGADVAWPTIALAALIVGGQASLLCAALTGVVPAFAATVPLGLLAYAGYTLVHESVHGNVLGKGHARRDGVHDALGWYGSLSLMMTWPLLRRTHQRHHAQVNGPDDPDRFVHGPLWRVIAMSAAKTAGLLFPLIALKPYVPRGVPIASYLHADELMTSGERKRHFGVQAAVVTLVWLAILAGFGAEALALYVLPAAIGRTLLGIAFQWWPHAPFTGTGRFTATRNGLRGWHLPMLYQNYHLMHHMWPAVPWYRYRRLHAALRPVLDAHAKA